MKKSLHLLFAFIFAVTSQLSAQDWAWAKSAGGLQKVESYSIAIDSAGNSYVTGWFENSLEFGTTTLVASVSGNQYASDIFIAKYDKDGDFVWAQRAGGTNYDYGTSIATDPSGNVYVTGLFIGTVNFGSLSITSSTVDYDVFIAKYDASGNALWVKKGGGSVWDVGNGIAVDKFSNCYITGGYRNTATFGTTSFTSAGNYDIFVAKYDSNGNFIWAQSAGGTGDDRGQGISVDPLGNCFITGFFKGTITIATNTIVSSGDSDIFLAKYNSSGVAQWGKRAGGIAADEGNSIKVSKAGSIYVTGYYTDSAIFDTTAVTGYGNTDIFAAMYDFKGDLIWVKKYGGSWIDKGYGISVDTFSNVYVTGSFWGTGQFDTISVAAYNQDDAFVAGIDNQNKTQWVLKGGSLNTDVSRGIAATEYGRCYITGYYTGSAEFGSHTISGASDNDLFVAKIDSTFIYDSIPLVDTIPNDTTPSNTGIAHYGSSTTLTAYPNPFERFVTISIGTTETINHVEIYDVMGKAVGSQAVIEKGQGSPAQKQLLINGENLINGIYFVKVLAGNKVFTTRLMLIK